MARNSTYEKVMVTIIALLVLIVVGFVVRAVSSPSVSITGAVSVNASSSVVWPYLVDEGKRPKWQTGVRTVANLMGEDLMVGSRSVIVKKVSSHQWEVEEEILNYVEGQLLTYVHSSEDYIENITIELKSVGNGVEISYSSSKLYSSFKDRLFAPWLSYQEGRALAVSLQNLKNQAEE